MQIYESIQSGNCAPELKQMFEKLRADAAKNGVDGKPVIDPEGGTVI